MIVSVCVLWCLKLRLLNYVKVSVFDFDVCS